MKPIRSALALTVLTLAASAQAAIVTSALNNVSILGDTYNVTFTQDTVTSFDLVFGAGSSPNLFFTTANAAAATADLLAALNTAGFDPTPASPSSTMDGFVLPFAYTATGFDYYTGFVDSPSNSNIGVFGPFTTSRAFGSRQLSYVSFERVGGTVPEPGSLALVGLAFGGLLMARRRS